MADSREPSSDVAPSEDDREAVDRALDQVRESLSDERVRAAAERMRDAYRRASAIVEGSRSPLAD